MARSLMPEKILDTQHAAYGIDHLILGILPPPRDIDERAMYLPATWLCGYRIPPFQRALCWTQEQETKFIENMWKGYHIGTYLVNDAMEEPMVVVDGKEYWHPTDRWLVDGQQRLTAIDRYIRNQFQIFGYFWKDLTLGDQRSFRSISFNCSKLKLTDEAVIRQIYNDLNFAGTPHKESDRA